jgi:Ca-activated chloride channel family protein
MDRVRGQIDAESVRMVVRHHLPQIRACYERALKGSPGLAGIIEIRLVISGEGRVRQAEVDRNSTGHEGLGKCIALTMSRWRFPRPVGGVEIEVIYPFSFARGGR